MGFLISPGVEVNEIDLTNIIPAQATSIGAFAGFFKWGPTDTIVNVGSEKDLARIFGSPTEAGELENSFFTAASFLKYGNSLKVVRANVTGSLNSRNDVYNSSNVKQSRGTSNTTNVSSLENLATVNVETLTITTQRNSTTNDIGYTRFPKNAESAFTIISAGQVMPVGTYVKSGAENIVVATERLSVISEIGYTREYIPAVAAVNITATGQTMPVGTYVKLGDSVRAIGRYVGTSGDAIKAYFVKSDTVLNSLPSNIRTSLSFTPSTTDWAKNLSTQVSNPLDEVSIFIVDSTGQISGNQGEILERYEGLSLAKNAKNEFNQTNYWVEVINARSNFIYALEWSTDVTLTTTSNSSTAFPFPYLSSDNSLTFSEGSNGSSSNFTGSVISGSLELFNDAESVDINLLFAHNFNEDSYIETKIVDNKLFEIVESRRDCVAFVSAPIKLSGLSSDSAKLSAVDNKFNSFGSSSSYVVFDSSPVYMYNRYRDSYVWVAACGHMAGLCAKTDRLAAPWFSPAGFNRGALLGVTKLAYNPKAIDRDELYSNSINCICSIPGQGIVLYGDKTSLKKPSAFDRINVRRLFVTIEKAIATASKFQLFELNDEFTRASFRNAVNPYLRDVQGRRGIIDFRVICDETNNTSEVIDSNRFVGTIYIKPSRSINFITLNFVATRTGVSFEEIIGQ